MITLHLGAHKTASSALQAALQENSGILVGHDVLTIPRFVVAKMLVDEHRLELREMLENSSASALIITHEVILGWPFGPPRELTPQFPYLYPEAKKRLEFLSQVVDGLDVQVVYYIRNQDTFLESFYIQSVQMGATYTFDEWISHIDLGRLSWSPIIEEIKARFPICVKRFETEFADSQSAAFRRFLAFAAPYIPNEELDQLTFEQPVNRSLNETGLVLMTEINKLGLDSAPRTTLRGLLQKHLSNVKGDRASFLSDRTRAILAAYEPENKALAQSTIAA